MTSNGRSSGGNAPATKNGCRCYQIASTIIQRLRGAAAVVVHSMNSPVSRQPKPLVMVVSLSPNVDFTAPNSCLTPATRHERKHLDKKDPPNCPCIVLKQGYLSPFSSCLPSVGSASLGAAVMRSSNPYATKLTCGCWAGPAQRVPPCQSRNALDFKNANTVPELVLVNRMELHRSRLLRDSRAASRGSAACRACMLSSSTENRHRKFC